MAKTNDGFQERRDDGIIAVMNARGFVIPALLGILIAAVVVGAAIYGTRREEPESDAPAQSGLSLPQPDLKNFTGTAGGILAEGQDISCSVSRSDAAGSVTGNAYVAGKGRRLRGDFVLTRPDNTKVNGHVIIAGGNSYFWADELPQGVKRAVPQGAEATPTAGSETNVFDESLTYTCAPWTVEAEVFALPAGKEFVELAQP